MRSSTLATLFGFSLVACAGQIESGPGDDDIPANCGNAAMDTGETCDDGNNLDGDGCSATCQTESVPRVTVTVDKPSLATDLIAANTVVVTFTSVDGFSGAVTLVGSYTDAANAPITDWAPITPAQVDVPAGGTAMTMLTLSIPGDTGTLAGTLKLSVNGSGFAQVDTPIAITANPVATIVFSTQGTLCKYPGFDSTTSLKVKAGRQLKIVDGGALPMTIHFSDSGNKAVVSGLGHQGGPMDLNGNYTQTTNTTAGGQATFYCHSPDALNGVNVATDGVNARQVVDIVP